MQMEQPDLYQHPAPFEVNPYWQEEISLGPGPPPRRARNRTANSSNTEKSSKTDGGRTVNTTGTQSTMGSQSSSATDLGLVQKPSSLLGGHSWNRKRYHRPDEEFLEHISEQNDPREGPVQQGIAMGSSVGVSGWAITKPASVYYATRAPPVNDLHPPVVSTPPSSWRDRQWMKAKPPSAAFMEGKKSVTNLNRSRSGLGNPKAEPSTDPEREILRKESQPTDGCASDQVLEAQNTSQPSARPPERADSSISHPGARERRKKRRPRPLRISHSSDDETDFSDDEMPASTTSARRKPFRRVSYVSRTKSSGRVQGEGASDSNVDEDYSPVSSPTLTARSDRDVIIPSSYGNQFQPITSKTNRTCHSHRRPEPKKMYDSSLAILQDLVDSQTLLNSKFAKNSPLKVHIPLPRSESDRNEEPSSSRGNADIEALWLDERDVARWGKDRRWSMEF